MGLSVTVLESGYGSSLNVFDGHRSLCVTNMEGGHKPGPHMPAAKLVVGINGQHYLVPDDDFESGGADGVQMNGGNYAVTSDSRWREQLGHSYPIPIFDRRETWAEYDMYSR
jgi:hypothetical protein